MITEEQRKGIESIVKENQRTLISIEEKTKVKRLSGSFIYDTYTGNCSNCNSTRISKESIPFVYGIKSKNKPIKEKGEYDIRYFCRKCGEESEDVKRLAPNFHEIYRRI